MNIQELVQKYHSNRANHISPSFNETQLRSDFLDPLFELLGWDIENGAGKPTNEREVLLEEPLKANASENSKKPDYTFRLFSERKFFLEAKKPSISIENNNATAKQIRRYGFTAKLKISVLSNFEYLMIYDCSVLVDQEDNFNKALIKKYHYTEYEENFEELKTLLGKDSVYTGQFDEEWKAIEEKINHFSVDKLFLEQINEWRVSLGAEIYQHKPDIDEQLLNDYVQSYINRIIFLRVCEDRNLETYQTLLQFANDKDFNALVEKFNQADRKYNSGLFDQFLSERIIGDISSVFWTIIQQLYYPESPYSFAVFSSDILGSIYEIFLSEKLSIKDGNIELIAKPENTDRDIITTPNFIIKSILNQTVVPFCEGKNDVEILESKFADISCGSGAFLLEMFQLLNDILVDYYLANDPAQLIQTNTTTYKLLFQKKKQLLLNSIFGIDKDYNAVEAAKFGLLLKLLEGEDNTSIGSGSSILPDLSGNIHFGNSLVSSTDILNNQNLGAINPFDFQQQYDVIVGNPPYMKSEDMKKFISSELPIYRNKYQTAYMQFDKYFLFVERGLMLLKENGWLGYIVPSKFAKVGAGFNLRSHLKDNNYLHSITSFGAQQVFSSKTTYTCLLILKKEDKKEFDYHEVKNLNQWKTTQDKSITYQKEQINDLNNEAWILMPSELKPVHDQIIKQSIPLMDILEEKNITNGIQTSKNPLYIITPSSFDDTYAYFEVAGVKWPVEKEVLRAYYKTPGKKAEKAKFNTYSYVKPNSFVIFPYKRVGNRVEIIPEDELKERYPKLHEYFKFYEKDLRSRDVSPPIGLNDWFKFGRSQHLDSWEAEEKIIVGVLSEGNKYPIDKSKTIVTSGGTAGYCILVVPKDCNYSIYYLQALLNSKYLEWYSALIGEVFRGGYIARGTKVLKRLPIRVINFEDPADKAKHDNIVSIQKSLIQKQEEIDRLQGDRRNLTIAERQFDTLKEQLNASLIDLYALTTGDSLIPLIKEMYEAN